MGMTCFQVSRTSRFWSEFIAALLGGSPDEQVSCRPAVAFLALVFRREIGDLPGLHRHAPPGDDGHSCDQAQADRGQGCGNDMSSLVHCDLHQPTDGNMALMLAAPETTSLRRTFGRS